MKYLKISMVIFAVLSLTACFLLGGNGVKTITGSILVSTTNVKVGAFSGDYWFTDTGAANEDEVGDEISTAVTSFTPIAMATITGSTYTIDLPDDVTTMGELIAWVDTNDNDIFDFNNGAGEAGYFPMRDFDGTSYVVSIGYLFDDYAYSYYDGSTNNIATITADVSDGYNFTID